MCALRLALKAQAAGRSDIRLVSTQSVKISFAYYTLELEVTCFIMLIARARECVSCAINHNYAHLARVVVGKYI